MDRHVSRLLLYGLPIFIIPLHDFKLIDFDIENNYHFKLSNLTFTCSESIQIRQWVHYIRKSTPIRFETMNKISSTRGIRGLQNALSSTILKSAIPKIVLQKQFMLGTLIINSPVYIDGNNSCIRNEENDEPTIIITCDNVYISNLVIQHCKFDDDNVCAIRIKGNRSHVTMTKCFIKCDNNAIQVDHGSQIEILDSTIHNSYHGLVLGNRSHAVIENSRIKKNHCGIHLEPDSSIELCQSIIQENEIGIFAPHTRNDSIIMDDSTKDRVYCNNNRMGIRVNHENK
jgi:hypothetical protein